MRSIDQVLTHTTRMEQLKTDLKNNNNTSQNAHKLEVASVKAINFEKLWFPVFHCTNIYLSNYSVSVISIEQLSVTALKPVLLKARILNSS